MRAGLLLSELLAGENPGQASAAEYSGDSRQVCWVVTGSAPRPNGNGPYHCFHEFDCSDPGAVCMEAGGEVSSFEVLRKRGQWFCESDSVKRMSGCRRNMSNSPSADLPTCSYRLVPAA